MTSGLGALDVGGRLWVGGTADPNFNLGSFTRFDSHCSPDEFRHCRDGGHATTKCRRQTVHDRF
jgi:hypothetical protein